MPWGLFWIVFETMVMNITEHHQLGCEWCGPRNSPRPKKTVRRHIFCTHCTNELNMGYQIWVPSWDPTHSLTRNNLQPTIFGGLNPNSCLFCDDHFRWFPIFAASIHNSWCTPYLFVKSQFQLIKYLVKSTMFAPLQFIFAWLIWYNYRFG
jgi:hypothetical protein